MLPPSAVEIYRSTTLNNHPLFKTRAELLSPDERVALSYERVKLLLKIFPLETNDIQHCTGKFWTLMRHPILCTDIAMYTILTIHIGLVVGTLSRHAHSRPEFARLCESLLKFEICGIYQLSERGHGVDAFSIETTATKTPSGYIINGEREESAKWMPASTPLFGIAKVSLVAARLIDNGRDCGIRLFVVPVCNQEGMYKGVISTRLPPRPGTSPLDFAHTRFHNVLVPYTALVSADPLDVSSPLNERESFWHELWRIPYGTMYVSAPFVSGIKAAAFITASYSMHRCVSGPGGKPFPIIGFRTQQWPVAEGIAAGLVYEEFLSYMSDMVLNETEDPRLRHALIAIIKSTIVRHTQRILPDCAERLGAQGTLEHNFIARFENDTKGAVIVEGDILPLCTKVFTEVLQGLYNVPFPHETLLGAHAQSLLTEYRQAMSSYGGPKAVSFRTNILPQAELAIISMGHAFAYKAATTAKLPQTILDVYEASVLKCDPAWYAENGVSRATQREMVDSAVKPLVHNLPEYLEMLNIRDVVNAPAVSDEKWKTYLLTLPSYSGDAVPGDVISCRVPYISARL